MAIRKAAGCVVVLLLLYYCAEKPATFLAGFLQEFGDAHPFQTHHLEKRNTPPNATEYVVEIVFVISNLNVLRSALSSLSLPLITNNIRVTAIDITTVCSPISSGHQCICEDGYAFSSQSCTAHDVCDRTTGGRCGCINSTLDSQSHCERNTSSVVTPTPAVTFNATEAKPTPTETKPTTTKAKPTPTKPNPTPTEPKPTPSKIEKNLNFTMDIPFKSSYNDETSAFYQKIYNTIETEFKNLVTGSKVKTLKFRNGSTIADYTMEAAPTAEVDAVVEIAKIELLRTLRKEFQMIIDSPTPLQFNPRQAFNKERLIVSCGPPPESLSGTWTREWWRDNVKIFADSRHSFSTENKVEILTISKLFLTDNAVYECLLNFREENSTFRQRGEFKLTPIPKIQVFPVLEKVSCVIGTTVERRCSVQEPYRVRFRGTNDTGQLSISDPFTVQNCDTAINQITCEEVTYPQHSRTITVEITRGTFTCTNDPVFGNGLLNDVGRAACEPDEEGEKTAICESNGLWGSREDTCVLTIINQLLEESESLNSNTLPSFLEEVSKNIIELSDEVTESPNNIDGTVAILENIADLALSSTVTLNKGSMTDFLKTASVLTNDKAKNSWDALNSKAVQRFPKTRQIVKPNNVSTSSLFLFAIESVARALTNDSFSIATDNILLDKTTFANTFSADVNSSVEIDLQESNGGNHSLTMLTFASMHNVVPPRDEENSSLTVINGNVVIVQSSGAVDNISFTFDMRNTSLEKPQCVFWNFSLFDRLGGWDDEGCELVDTVNGTVTCNCNHLTAFSMLMSPFVPDNLFLEIITYIGVAISIACLVICLILEGYTWKRMKLKDLTYLRHVCIVNIAVSLLTADIWFIIGAAVSETAVKSEGTCSTVAFFIHLFYLALFFWMLLFGILLINSMFSVFNTGTSKRSKLALGFSLGYGAPLVIAVITIAVTAPNQEYTASSTVCWLNFFQSKALLAFVIPALTIVAINLVILVCVLGKMLVTRNRDLGNSRRGQQQSDVVVIIRTVAILSPFFGLTWSLGVGTMVEPLNFGLHVAFAFFNSLQGLFILVFGTLWDKKVRKELGLRSSSSMSSTRNTTSGTSSSGLLDRFRRRGRDGFNVSTSNSSGNT